MKPLAIDLFCGLGGWTEGALAAGYECVGFDIEQHDYGDGKKYPAQLVIQDVLTLHGRQFKDAALILASPPCQEFSYMAMPWSKAKAKQRSIESDPKERKRLTALFDACFRLQCEACASSGRRIPLVVENVRGAQKWVGRSAWNFGSFHLWGDIPALMPIGEAVKVGGFDWSKYGEPDYKAQSFTGTADRLLREEGRKSGTKAWFGDDKNRNSLSTTSSKSTARKLASATIAKIPFVLSHHICKVWKPN